MCTTVALLGTTSCQPGIGGAGVAYVAKFSEITGFTVTAGKVSAITMSNTSLWKKWLPTKDSTAYFKATGERPSKNVFLYNQEGYLKYASVTEEAVKAGNSMITCCDLVVVWFLENGSVLLQGVQLNAAGTGVEAAKEPALFTPTIDSASGDDGSKVEFLIQAKAKNQVVADMTLITPSYIEGL